MDGCIWGGSAVGGFNVLLLTVIDYYLLRTGSEIIGRPPFVTHDSSAVRVSEIIISSATAMLSMGTFFHPRG